MANCDHTYRKVIYNWVPRDSFLNFNLGSLVVIVIIVSKMEVYQEVVRGKKVLIRTPGTFSCGVEKKIKLHMHEAKSVFVPQRALRLPLQPLESVT